MRSSRLSAAMILLVPDLDPINRREMANAGQMSGLSLAGVGLLQKLTDLGDMVNQNECLDHHVA